MPAGRPSEYSEEIASIICERLALGESLREICSDSDMPSRPTVWAWRRENQEFFNQYARAREDQAEHFADEIIHIADTEEDAQKARVRIDARKWKAAKMDSARFGEKVQQEHTGKDGGPIKTEWVVVDPSSPSTDS